MNHVVIDKVSKSNHSSPNSVISLGLGDFTDQVLDVREESRERQRSRTNSTSNSTIASNSKSSNTNSTSRKHSLRNRTSSITSQPVCPIELQKALDPEIQQELENLNICSNKINEIEHNLQTCRSEHRAVLSKSAQLLGQCSKKLGNCVEKARPFYIAKYKAKAAQKCAQDATQKYERAVSNHEGAKEMVNYAEQSMRLNATDPAWHQMLNHATNRVNESEIERHLIEQEVQRTTKLAITTQQSMSRLNKDNKNSISMSREYFELKNKLSEKLDLLQRKVEKTQEELSGAKINYKAALKRLENISERIHYARDQQKRRLKKKSSSSQGGHRSRSESLERSNYQSQYPRKNSNVSNSELSNISDSHESCGSSSTQYKEDYHSTVTISEQQEFNLRQDINTKNKSSAHSTSTVKNTTPSAYTKIPEEFNRLEESRSVVEMALAKHRQRHLSGMNSSLVTLSPTRNYSKDDLHLTKAQSEIIIHEDLKRRDSLEKLDGQSASSGSFEGISKLGVDFSMAIDSFLMRDQGMDVNLQKMNLEQTSGTFNNRNHSSKSMKSQHSSHNNMSLSSGVSSQTGSVNNMSDSGYGRQNSGSKMGSFTFKSLNVKDLGK